MSQLPKYQQIKQDLIARIGRGDYEADLPFTTQREICETYGVSMLTAARALTELSQEGVLTSERGRGTFVARRAVAVRDRSARARIACVVPTLSSGDVMEFLSAAQTRAEADGFDLSVTQTEGSWSAQHEALLRANAAAVILWAVDGPSDPEAAQALADAGVPLVFADRYWIDCPGAAVLIDHESIGYDLATRMIQRGYRRLATLWYEYQATSMRDRMSGYRRAMRDAGIPLDASLTPLRDYLSRPAAQREQILRDAVGDEPVGFLCGNGYVVDVAVDDALRLGLDIGGDAAFAGTDRKENHLPHYSPLATLTAVLPTAEVGERAAAIAATAATTGAAPGHEQVLIPSPELIEREDARPYVRAILSIPSQ
jgi:GntR family transcriptional regulator, arabinose operon transcriptional repressor